MKAVVLAAGEGLRLRPLTGNRPKVMIRIANKPILEYVVNALVSNNVRDIILVVGYRKEQIMTYFGDGSRWNANISYVVQEKQLGTAHALHQAKDRLEGRFLVLPGDNIIDPDTIKPLMDGEGEWSMIISKSSHPSKYGVVSMDGRPIKSIVEKPEQEISNLVSTGIYSLTDEFLPYIEEVSKHLKQNDLTSVVQYCIEDGKDMNGEMTRGRWMDAVYPWDILSLNAEALKDTEFSRSGKVEPNVMMNGQVSVGEGSIIRSGTYIQGPVQIGKGCDIGPNVVLLPATTLGSNVTVNPFTEIRNSVIMSDVSIGGASVISHSVIGDGCQIGSHFSACSERSRVIHNDKIYDVEYIGSILGDDIHIGNQVSVESGIIVGSNSRISSQKAVSVNVEEKSNVL